ncbi:MAG: SlyX family protein [Pseudodesulfovibrio sp.]|jgi:SlyX protein|uniref:SlyX protein n=1 Tax=Pseudodesulfovibrio indicus TaxID=1716143 RepID=A0A126QK46_9BACT|nr:SlyX family protein [Pseudodesulfovibrio indicus]AMK10351.1 SlyX protein [Pseudodesulfovibrio indicus]TDT81962.1 SlyX protein [Pseudodesulfovibrio indicus]
MEKRLERLESLIALQDRTIEKLSDQLYEQQKRIDGLERLAERMAGKLRTLGEQVDASGPLDVPPPHYNG